jgi:superfamily II DNA or RNA helicase
MLEYYKMDPVIKQTKKVRDPNIPKRKYTRKIPLAQPAAATAANPPVKQARCPSGFRRNRRTGDCDPVGGPVAAQPVAIAVEPPVAVAQPPVALAVAAEKQERCPRGFRRNRRTGICDPVAGPAVIPPPALAPPAIVPPAIVPPAAPVLAPEAPPAIVPPAAPVLAPEVPPAIVPPAAPALAPLALEPPALAPVELPLEDLEKLTTQMNENKCENPENYYTPKCNELLLQKEELETSFFANNQNQNNFLYPNINDPNFNAKIAKKKEFADNKYDGEVYNGEEINGVKYGIKEHAETLNNSEYSLRPHQIFVKNFLSSQTPFNTLLLYHGLGSGKTCSAIGVCEETRDYFKQMGITKRIIIVASPNVLDNFRLQLFDENKLKLVNGIWTMDSCIGNKLLNELNPLKLKGIKKEHIITKIKNLIKTSYLFLGYIKFASYIEKNQNKLEREFNDRFIVIDEIHNIRMSDDNNEENQKVARKLLELVSSASNLRLLLLSATPMYNNCREIVWLLNIINRNDRRATIDVRKIFNSNDDFVEGGRELLIRKMRGYVSFVRGENPYVFPFRVFPKDIFPNDTGVERINILENHPITQMNGKRINDENKLKYLDLNVTQIGEYQLLGYNFYMNELKRLNLFSSLQFFSLISPLQALNIVYPMNGLTDLIPNPDEFYVADEGAAEGVLEGKAEATAEEEEEEAGAQEEKAGAEDNIEDEELNGGAGSVIFPLTGSDGLNNIMNVTENKTKYEYKNNRNRIFEQDKIGTYSSKIKNICQHIQNSTGIVLIYSQYIDGGLIPMALALEEMGFLKYDEDNENNTLLTNPPSQSSKRLKYTMITGDINISPNNDFVIKTLTKLENKGGEIIKVILLSKAGTEGIDLKFIRQIHIMEPWYNMSRIEQIIGRGVRDGSHKNLDFEDRNVEIYLHATQLPYSNIESADLYVYRNAEKKAIQIGEVTRLLKENSVDCIINSSQNNFTQANFSEKITQRLSCGKEINDFQAGDADYSSFCDYQVCKANPAVKINDPELTSYSEKFMLVNSDNIIKIIKMLMKERYFYKKQLLFSEINRIRTYPIEEIYAALTKIIDEKETITDRYSRNGTLINIGDYYCFQPIELTNPNIGMFERMVPLDIKPKQIKLDVTNVVHFKSDIIVPENPQINGKKVFDAIQKDYNKILLYANDPSKKITSVDEKIYQFCGIVLYHLFEHFKISLQEIEILLVEYLIDHLVFQDKLDLLNYIYSIQLAEETIDKKIFDYLSHNINKNKYIILYDDDKSRKLMKLEGLKWIDGDAYDARQLNPTLNPQYDKFLGFIDYDETDKMVFKIKDVTAKRNTGARCDQSQKKIKIKILNELFGDGGAFIDSIKPGGEELCLYQEFILKHYNKTRPDKTYFLTFDEYLHINK